MGRQCINSVSTLCWICCFVVFLATPGLTMETKKLSSGFDMPVIGLGTWQTNADDTHAAIAAALENGYRHIDTAFVYNNEEAIGSSLKKWFEDGGKREDLFITTKLSPAGHRHVEQFLNASLERLGLDYVDMYLIHTPFSFVKAENSFEWTHNEDGSVMVDTSANIVDTWKEMEKQVKAGRARSIGLSNFNESQLLEVWNNAEIKPSNLQIELQAYHQQKPLRDLCAKHDIAVTSYSTLGSPGSRARYPAGSPELEKFHDLLGHPTVRKIADAHEKTPAQVLLRHAIQNGIIVIPKSTQASRIKENVDIFDFVLTDEEMNEMNGLDKEESGRIFNFLDFKGVEKHPHYPFANELKVAA